MLSLFMVLGLITPAVNVAAETAAVKYTKVAVENPVANSWHNSGTDGGPDYAFNGNTGNWWHTNYGSTSTENGKTNIVVTSLTNGQVNEIPAFAEIVSTRAWIGGEFDNPVELGKFIYRSRTNTTTNWIQQWALYTANVTTDEPKDTDFSLAQTGTFTSSAEQEVVLTTPVTATHFRLVAFSFNGGQVTASKLEMYSVSEVNTENVRLRVGQTVTYKQDGGVEVSAPNPGDLNSIVTCEVVAGERIEYPYSTAKLATGVANFSGEEIELTDCLFTFNSSNDGYTISHTKEDGTVIYFASGASTTGSDPATRPCVSSGSNLVVLVGIDNGMFTFNNKYGGNTNGYLYFHKNDSTKLHFNRNTNRSSDTDKTNTSFDLFTPDESADSEIKGYRKISGLDEIVSGQSYLIAAKAQDNNYYILRPIVSENKSDYVAKVITHEAPVQPAVQLASSQGNFNVEGLKKVSDCLFTFTFDSNVNIENRRYTISAKTENGEMVYLNHRVTDKRVPTTQIPNNQIAVSEVSIEGKDFFTLFDNATPNTRSGYLYFHRDSGYTFNQNSSTAGRNTAFELYKPSSTAPEDSKIRGYVKVTSKEDIENGGQYLIVNTNTDESAYYFLYPIIADTEATSYKHVAKLTNTMIAEEYKATDSEITFTAIKEGETSVKIGDITYNIVVKNKDKTITLRNGESTLIVGTLQNEVETEGDIRVEVKEAIAPYTTVSDITEGTYLIGSTSHMIINSASSSTSPKGLAMQSANYTQGDYEKYAWKVTASGNGYTIQDANGKYINFTEQNGNQCSVVLSDTAQVLNIVKRDGGSFGVSYGSHYINNFDEGNSNAAGWNSNNNAWYFYRGNEGVEVTSLGDGTATITIDGINYHIESAPTSAAELRTDIANAESTYVAENYLVREWLVYAAALEEAKEWAANEATATQPEIEAARVKLANAIAALIPKLVYDDAVTAEKEMAAGAPTGTTQNQPFADGTAGSNNFRIPALITLSDGTIVAASDARWNWSRDAKSIDIIMSKSTDGGKTWNYTLPIFFNDSTNQAADYGACFIDPLMVRDKNDKIYLLVDLYPGGIAINSAPATPHAASGFVDILGEKRLVLYTSDTPSKQNDTNYSYYVGDYVKDGDVELAPVYEVLGENDYSTEASFYMDPYFYLYTAEKEPMYCLQLGDNTKKVQQNVFFHNSLLHVRAATYLYLVTSEDKGETWSAPMLLNSQIRKESNLDIFYGVGPGAGLWIDDGTEHGIVMMPAYSYSNQIASFVYSADGGVTWKRSQNATTSSWSSESCLVQIDDTTVRHFFRSGTSTLQYTDHTFVDGEWVAGSVVTMNDVARKNNNQVSAIRYSKTINGKPVIIFSTATTGGPYDRKNGKIYVFTVDMEADGKPMTLVATYDNDPSSETDVYAYSSIAELKDGSIGLLYEYDDTANACKITYKTIPMSELAPDVRFDIPASEEGVRSEVAGYNLILEGTIGLKFHMLFGQEVIDDATDENGAYVKFTVGNTSLNVPVSEAEKVTEDDITYYVFKCPVPVKDMDTTVTAQVILTDGRKGFVHTYKVQNYIDYITENQEDYQKVIELVTKMSDFGDYAATYFADETTGETPELPQLTELTDDDMTVLEGQKAVVPEGENSIYYGSSLLLRSNTIIRHYFKQAVEGSTPKGNLYYIELEGISADLLGTKIETTVKITEDESITISYSPLSYAYIALTRDGVDEKLKNVMHAMYLYYQAAQNYIVETTN